MPRKSKVRRNQRSKRVQRNRNRSNRRYTKRFTKRGRRTNVRKNSKKVNSKRRNKKIKSRRSYNKRKLQRGGDTSVLTLLSQLGLDKFHKPIVDLMKKSPVPPEPITGIEYLQKLDGEDPAYKGDNRIGDFFANVRMSPEDSKRMITALRSGIHNLLKDSVIQPQPEDEAALARMEEIENALASSEPGRVPIVNIKGLYEFKTSGENFERFGMSRAESIRLVEELECPKLHGHLLHTSPLRENLAAYGRDEAVILLSKGDVYEGITVFKDSTAGKGGNKGRESLHRQRARVLVAEALDDHIPLIVPEGQRGEPPKHYLKCDFCDKEYIHRTNGDGLCEVGLKVI